MGAYVVNVKGAFCSEHKRPLALFRDRHLVFEIEEAPDPAALQERADRKARGEWAPRVHPRRTKYSVALTDLPETVNLRCWRYRHDVAISADELRHFVAAI